MADKKKKSKKIAGNNTVDVYGTHVNRYEEIGIPAKIISHSRIMLDPRAQFAMQCIEKWAMVAGEENGESSDGRQKLRRLTPEEVVNHAMSCSKIAFEEFNKQGWLIDIPSLEDISDKLKDIENSNG